MPEEIKRKTISLGRGVIRDTIYININFIDCMYTNFKRVKFKNCTFKNNSFVTFTNVHLDTKCKIL